MRGNYKYERRLRLGDYQDIEKLKAAHQHPSDLEKKVEANRIAWELKKAGKLPAWEWVKP